MSEKLAPVHVRCGEARDETGNIHSIRCAPANFTSLGKLNRFGEWFQFSCERRKKFDLSRGKWLFTWGLQRFRLHFLKIWHRHFCPFPRSFYLVNLNFEPALEGESTECERVSPSCPTSLDVHFNDKSLSYVSHEVNDHKDARSPVCDPFSSDSTTRLWPRWLSSLWEHKQALTSNVSDFMVYNHRQYSGCVWCASGGGRQTLLPVGLRRLALILHLKCAPRYCNGWKIISP